MEYKAENKNETHQLKKRKNINEQNKTKQNKTKQNKTKSKLN